MEKPNFSLRKKALFLVLFAAMMLVGDRINFSPLVGAKNQFFTLFQLFGPLPGAFLGPVVGGLSVLIAEVANYVIRGKAFDVVNVARLAPMIFAAYYFGTYKRGEKLKHLGVLVPILAIIAFNLHPVGRHVWFVSLFMTIPVLAKLLPENLLLRSLGSTFTAYAVGTAFWIWLVPMTATQWVTLIPVVVFERSVFSLGIASSYVAMTTVLDRLALSWGVLNIEKKYALFRAAAG